MANNQTMKALLAAIQTKESEIERINIEIGALREVYNREAGIRSSKPRAGRSDVKTTVLNLLTKVGSTGLNAQIACEMAKDDGQALHIKSVSSLLSRLKSDGTVQYVGSMYVLKEFVQQTPFDPASQPIGNVVRPLRSSGRMS